LSAKKTKQFLFMSNTTNQEKKIFLGYLILTFYYLGALAMIFALTYPPFKEVHENFKQHAIVFERYLIWVLYIPGVLMLLSAVALIFFRPACLPKWAIAGSAFLSLISVVTMFFGMVPLHHDWTTAGFDNLVFEQSKNITFAFQIIPSLLQALMAAGFMYVYLSDVQRTTRILFILLFILCFFPMGTIIVECHLNYALWATVAGNEWPAYRQAMDMPVFLAIFLIPFYLPIVLLIVIVCKKRAGLSRGLVMISLIALLYVFVISAAYFVPDIQFELDKYHSPKLLEELIRNEIWLRTPAELAYWATVAVMFWKFRPSAGKTESIA
jgi:hypothetical protein